MWFKVLPVKDEVDLGFRFKVDAWKKGYATEAAFSSLKLAFEKFKLTNVVARTMKENLSSQAVLCRVGMRFDSEFIENDVIWFKYSLSKDDYLKKCK